MNSLPKFEKVMIIDDNQIDRYITSRTIVKSNFGKTVLEFSAATDALQYLEDNQDKKVMLPEIIFVDIYMPIMSGFQFMDNFVTLSGNVTNNCGVFIISSTIDESDIAKVRSNSNIMDFHQKPLTKSFLEKISLSYEI